VVPNETVPGRALRYLEPEERRVITVRKHPFLPMLCVLPLVLVLTDYLLRVTGAVYGTAQAKFILAVLLALCGILAVHSLVDWLTGYFVVTSNRLLLINWWRVSGKTEIPLSAAGELCFIRTFPGRLLGYGTFRLKRPGSRWRACRIRFVPYPEQLYIEVAGLIFRDPGVGDD